MRPRSPPSWATSQRWRPKTPTWPNRWTQGPASCPLSSPPRLPPRPPRPRPPRPPTTTTPTTEAPTTEATVPPTEPTVDTFPPLTDPPTTKPQPTTAPGNVPADHRRLDRAGRQQREDHHRPLRRSRSPGQLLVHRFRTGQGVVDPHPLRDRPQGQQPERHHVRRRRAQQRSGDHPCRGLPVHQPATAGQRHRRS